MGIPGFVGQWLRPKKFSNVIRRNYVENVSSVMIDANSIIHEEAQKTYAYGKDYNKLKINKIKNLSDKELENQLFDNISSRLLTILKDLDPTDLFMIAVDGVAPMAKIVQQRSRRFRIKKDEDILFNSNNITPGTDFMFRLDNFIKEWIRNNKQKLPKKVIYSSHMVPGEGEHKIMDIIRYENQIIGNKNHVIYGLDADLIMLSLLAPLDNIFLVRDKDIIDINLFRKIINETMGSIDDFVILTFFLGNDFLPHMPSLEDYSKSIDIMIDLYNSSEKRKFVLNDDIDIVSLTNFLLKIEEKEKELLNHESSRNFTYPSKLYDNSLIEKTIRIGDFQTSKIKTLDFNKFRKLWYKNEFKKNDENIMENIESMIYEYLKGIFWNYRYYKFGTSKVNTNWFYPYYHSPLFSDISIIASNIESNEKIIDYKSFPGQELVNPIYQLLSVMPLSSKEILPKEISELIDVSSEISDYYPVDFDIELEGKMNDWQGISILPFVDMKKIISAVNSKVSFTRAFKDKYSAEDNIVFDFTSSIEIRKRQEELEKTFGKSTIHFIKPGSKEERLKIWGNMNLLF
uniref:XRN 5'-3' exonuclease n=1 Tax=Pithovirus LCPAC104 TaxID=2506589 RepID=A0A481Z3S0_9VIRU|nr:MAG: XRN 5'-3' exonuclease [Pithovirus LCPAC104]